MLGLLPALCWLSLLLCISILHARQVQVRQGRRDLTVHKAFAVLPQLIRYVVRQARELGVIQELADPIRGRSKSSTEGGQRQLSNPREAPLLKRY